jgi:hypothetical protein
VRSELTNNDFTKKGLRSHPTNKCGHITRTKPLVADPGACRWTTGVNDPQQLALGALSTTGVAYLIHPEHGGSGIPPGRYIIRRQRERSGASRNPSEFPHAGNPFQYVVD